MMAGLRTAVRFRRVGICTGRSQLYGYYVLGKESRNSAPFTCRRSGVQHRRESSSLTSENATLARERVEISSSSEASGGNLFSTMSSRVNNILNKPRTIPVPRWVSPKHYSIRASEVFGHCSFLLVGISYAVDDFLQLRILAVAGSTAMLVFTFYHPHGKTLWLPFKWNVLFIATNLWRIGKVYVEKYIAENLSEELKHVYNEHFHLMKMEDFYRLVRMGHTRQYRKGDVIVKQGEANKEISLVIKGEFDVLRDGQLTYKLREGNFISECGLHAGLLLRGRIDSCCTIVAHSDEAVLLRWNRTELVHLLEIDMPMLLTLKAVLSWDIVSKLKSQRMMLYRGLVDDPELWTQLRRQQNVDRYSSILHNMLNHPKYLTKRKEEFHKYRKIHQISDRVHEMALKDLGWTLADFEAGKKGGQASKDEDDEDEEVTGSYGWKWYTRELYLRIFG